MSKIEDGIVDFLINHGTFYASLISQMHRIVDRNPLTTPTIKVGIKNGRINMTYNPDFLEPRTMKDTKSILEHECLHIVCEHHMRAKNKDLKKWKIACDLAINQLLQHVPDDALMPEKFFGQDFYKLKLENMQDAEYYYNALSDSKEAQEKMEQMTGGTGDEHGHPCDNEFDGEACQNDDPELAKEVIKQMVKEAGKDAGKLPAGLQKYIDELFEPPIVNWRTILRKFVANSVKSGTRPSWKKPSRRYGDAQKGRVADRTIALVLGIDTSGSINDGMLKVFMTEIEAIKQSYKCEVTVIEADADVQREYKMKKFEKLKRDVKGGGGTNFAPLFAYIKKKHIRADAVIYFTDLCGDFPDPAPKVPTLWAYYDGGWGGSSVAPFGKVVKLIKGE